MLGFVPSLLCYVTAYVLGYGGATLLNRDSGRDILSGHWLGIGGMVLTAGVLLWRGYFTQLKFAASEPDYVAQGALFGDTLWPAVPVLIVALMLRRALRHED